MSSEDFQILDIEPIDRNIIKKDYLKMYQQQGAQLNQSDQNIELFVENNKHHQIGNGFLKLMLQYGKMVIKSLITMILFVK